MPVLNNELQFKFGVSSKFSTISKDLSTIYFLTDSQQLFVGETEYTRPIQHGTALPKEFMPANSLFVLENGTGRSLYYSKDGASWDLVSVLNAKITGGVFGSNTTGTASFGGAITIPKVTVDERGHITAAEDAVITLPSLSPTTTGSGNAITNWSVDASGNVTLAKQETFATSADLSDAKEELSTAIQDAIGGVTSFEIDAAEGTGYETLAALKSAHPEGTKGVFYLVVNSAADGDNGYLEYFWTGTAYELAGKFGDVDHSIFAKASDVETELSSKVDKTITVNGQALSGNVTITNIDGNARTATKLAQNVKINGVDFDGSTDITIDVPDRLTQLHDVNIDTATTGQSLVWSGSAWVNSTLGKADVGLDNVDNTADADKSVAEAIKATQDAAGNVITETYATKSEVTASKLVWGTF